MFIRATRSRASGGWGQKEEPLRAPFACKRWRRVNGVGLRVRFARPVVACGAEGGAKGGGVYLSTPPAQTRRRCLYAFRSRFLCVRGAEEGQKVRGVPFRASCVNEGAGPLRVPFARPAFESCSRKSRGWGRKGGVRWRVRQCGERDRGTKVGVFVLPTSQPRCCLRVICFTFILYYYS